MDPEQSELDSSLQCERNTNSNMDVSNPNWSRVGSRVCSLFLKNGECRKPCCELEHTVHQNNGPMPLCEEFVLEGVCLDITCPLEHNLNSQFELVEPEATCGSFSQDHFRNRRNKSRPRGSVSLSRVPSVDGGVSLRSTNHEEIVETGRQSPKLRNFWGQPFEAEEKSSKSSNASEDTEDLENRGLDTADLEIKGLDTADLEINGIDTAASDEVIETSPQVEMMISETSCPTEVRHLHDGTISFERPLTPEKQVARIAPAEPYQQTISPPPRSLSVQSQYRGIRNSWNDDVLYRYLHEPDDGVYHQEWIIGSDRSLRTHTEIYPMHSAHLELNAQIDLTKEVAEDRAGRFSSLPKELLDEIISMVCGSDNDLETGDCHRVTYTNNRQDPYPEFCIRNLDGSMENSPVITFSPAKTKRRARNLRAVMFLTPAMALAARRIAYRSICLHTVRDIQSLEKSLTEYPECARHIVCIYFNTLAYEANAIPDDMEEYFRWGRGLANILELCPNLQVLHLRCRGSIPALAMAKRLSPHLRDVCVVDDCSIGQNFLGLWKRLEPLKRLERFHLQHSQINAHIAVDFDRLKLSADCGDEIAAAVPGFHNLEHLHLENSPELTDQMLLTIVEKNLGLKSLSVSFCKFVTTAGFFEAVRVGQEYNLAHIQFSNGPHLGDGRYHMGIGQEWEQGCACRILASHCPNLVSISLTLGAVCDRLLREINLPKVEEFHFHMGRYRDCERAGLSAAEEGRKMVEWERLWGSAIAHGHFPSLKRESMGWVWGRHVR